MSAGKHATRRVTVHYRTGPIVAQGWADGPQAVADWALVAVAALCLTGVLPMLAAAGLVALVELLPAWSQVPACLSLVLAAMWLLVRVALTGDVR